MTRAHSWLALSLPFAAAVVATSLAVTTFAVIDNLERKRLDIAAHSEVSTQLGTVRARLEHDLNEPLVLSRGLVAFIRARGDITQSEFDRVAATLLNGPGKGRRITLARGTVISMTYPLLGNESTLGVDYRSLPTQWPTVERVIRTRTPALNGPVPLIQGGTGLIVRAPVYVPDPDGGEDRFFGLASVGLNMEEIFARAGVGTDELPIAIAIRGKDGRGAEGEMIAGDEAIFGQAPVLADVVLPYGIWRMAAVPRGGWGAVGKSELLLLRTMGASLVLLAAAAAFGVAFHLYRHDRTANVLRSRSLELERSNADLQQFAYVASHDLQTPLRNIISYTQLLERRYKGQLDADADDFIGFIVDSGKWMTRLIADLLAYSRISNQAASPQPTPVREAVDLALANLKLDLDAAGAEVSIGALPVVMAEQSHLVSLFQNLLGNALKYRAADRRLRLSISAERAAAGLWRFTVADNGIGIEPQYHAKIFEIFQRLHPNVDTEGTGIGLTLCRRIVHRFGGTIWLESVPGEGTTFLFTLKDGGGAP